MQFGREVKAQNNIFTTSGNYYELNLSVVANKLFVLDKKTFAEQMIEKCSENSFREIFFSYHLSGYPNKVQISFYTISIITGAVVFFGLATGFVEEMIFRGIIMGCLEKRFNLKVAVIFPSVLFGLLHTIGNNLDLISVIQLLIAGSIVGILFSLIAYESNSIWNSSVVHGLWNMILISGILYIGNSADNNSLFNFVLENKSFLLSGGDFGIEASIISIFVYFIFIMLAKMLLNKRHH